MAKLYSSRHLRCFWDFLSRDLFDNICLVFNWRSFSSPRLRNIDGFLKKRSGLWWARDNQLLHDGCSTPGTQFVPSCFVVFSQKTHSLDSLVRYARTTMLLFVGKTRSFWDKWWTVTQFKENFSRRKFSDNLIWVTIYSLQPWISKDYRSSRVSISSLFVFKN